VRQRPAAHSDVGAVGKADAGPPPIREAAVQPRDADDAVWVGQRERAEEEPVDDAEHRRRGPDGERGGQDDRPGHQRVHRHAARGIAQILPELTKHRVTSRLGTSVTDGLSRSCNEHRRHGHEYLRPIPTGGPPATPVLSACGELLVQVVDELPAVVGWRGEKK
jgi:hypothetical protein